MDIYLVAKITLVLAAALGLRACLGQAAASTRALLLTTTFAVVTVLPLATAVTPALVVPVPGAVAPATLRPTLAPSPAVMPVIQLPPDHRVESVAVAAQPPTAASTLTWNLARLWAAGTLACLLPLLFAVFRTWRVRQRAVVPPLTTAMPAPWQSQQDRFTLLVSNDVPVPMACGLLKPSVILPREALRWSDEQVGHAILHEAEHLRRQDWVVFVAARFTCALYWWHPLVWAAWRRLRADAEQACDDAVVGQADSVAYAEQLVSLAHRASGRAAPLIAMAPNSDLSLRVAAILDSTRNRRSLSSTMAWSALGIAVATSLGIAPLQVVRAQGAGPGREVGEPQRRAPLGVPAGHFTGVVHDPTGVPVPGLLLVVEPLACQGRTDRPNCGFDGTWERTDRQGRFRFERLPVGRFHLTSPVDYFPGVEFSVEQDATTEHDITMKVLPVEAQFTICTECPAAVVPDSLAKEFAADATASLDHPVSAPRPAPGWELYVPGMGVYPPDLANAGFEGSIVIEGIIGVDGVPAKFKVDVAADRRLAQAAIAALSVEVWEPGRIRGTAVEVPFRFLIRYSVSGKGNAQATPSKESPRFEVASVKRNTDPNAPLGIQPPVGGRFKAIATVQTYIQVAYGMSGSGALFEAQVVGLPAWARTDHFEINAVFDGPISTTSTGGADRLMAMLRALLASRFGLELLGETRQLPTYDLVLDRADGRPGPRLVRADGSCLPITPATGPIIDYTRYCGFKRAGPNAISARGLTLELFAGALAYNADVQRAVRDRTGLMGEFDLDLAFVPMNAPEPQTGVTLFTALREQLGLALRPSVGPVEVIVVENVRPPMPD